MTKTEEYKGKEYLLKAIDQIDNAEFLLFLQVFIDDVLQYEQMERAMRELKRAHRKQAATKKSTCAA